MKLHCANCGIAYKAVAPVTCSQCGYDPREVEAIPKTAGMSDTCNRCGTQIWRDTEGVWIDNSGGDVCGWDGGNEPHEPLCTLLRR